jgi:Phage tail tube protein
MSSSSQHKFSIVPEANYGVTPANPQLRIKNIVSASLALTKGKIESATIRPDRQVQDVRHGNRQIGGDVVVELAYGAFDDILEAVLCGTWEDNLLFPGVIRRSFTAVRQFTDLEAGANPFQFFKGVEFNTMGISIAPEKIVEVTFGCVGRELIIGGAQLDGAADVAASTAKPIDSFTGILTVDGAEVGSVTEISLNIENGIEPRFVVFNDKTNQPKIGKCRVTGTLTTYFQDSSFLVAFNGGIKRALNFELEDKNGNRYVFDLPGILPMSGATDVKGEDDITIPVQFQAVVADTDDEPAISIERLDA